MKTFLFLGAVIAMLLPALALSAEYQSEAERYVMENSIMFPQFGSEFGSELPVTRLEFTVATIDHLYDDGSFDSCFEEIAPSLPVKYRLLFGDVEKDAWFGKRLCAAMLSGLINGDGDGNFRPFDDITTAEASKILARAYGLLYPASSESRKPWYQGPMLALSMRGAIGSRVAPEKVLARADMAQMFFALRNTERFPETRVIGRSNPQATPVVTQSPSPRQESLPCAAYIRTARRRTDKRISRRLLRIQVEQAYENGKPDDLASHTILMGCPELTARTPGMGLRVQGDVVPHRIDEHISTRALRATAEYRR